MAIDHIYIVKIMDVKFYYENVKNLKEFLAALKCGGRGASETSFLLSPELASGVHTFDEFILAAETVSN